MSSQEKDASFVELLQKEFDCLIPKKPLTAGEIVSIRNAVTAFIEQKVYHKNLNFAYACSADQFQKGEQYALHELIEALNKE